MGRTALLLSILLSASTFAAASAPQVSFALNKALSTEVLTQELRDELAALLDRTGKFGYAVGVVRPHAEVQMEYFVWGNRTEDGEPMTKDTIIGIGSISKQFTATALGLVMDDFAHGHNRTPLPVGISEFTWKTKAKDILPGDWKLEDRFASEYSNIQDLLSHMTGMPNHDFAYGRNDTAIGMVRRMRWLRSAFELREEWHYNNMAYMLAQHLVERYSGQDLPSFVAERIFGPLNMSSTTYSSEAANATGRLTQSFSSFGRRIPTWLTATDIPLIAGAGSMLSTIDDLASWAKLLLNATTAPIPRAILDDCMRPHALVPPGDITYGFGFGQRHYKGHRTVRHAGGLPGVSSAIIVLPDDDAAIILLANADDKLALNIEISNRIIASLFGIDADPSYTTRTNEDSPPAETYDAHDAEPLDTFAGNYFDAGYGALSLCAPISTTPACRSLVDGFRAVDGAFDPRALYASTNSFWVSQIRFPRTGNTTFGFVPTTLFPEGFGENTTSFEVLQDAGPLARVEFVRGRHGRVEGFGLFGLAGMVLDRERRGSTLQEKAEVWFERTGDLE